MKHSKSPKHPTPNTKINDPALVHMRDVAYGSGMISHIHRTTKRADELRNDDALLAAAEAKRLRKANRNKGNKS